MRNIARLSDNDRRELFRNTADKMGLNDAIVEKDFWVCFTLDYLFHRSPWKESITFKGGTSLSKAFHLISRFSEDIDLILDWRVLGYGKDEPWEKRSNTKHHFRIPGQENYTRCDTLKGDYTEQAIKERIAGTRTVKSRHASSKNRFPKLDCWLILKLQSIPARALVMSVGQKCST